MSPPIHSRTPFGLYWLIAALGCDGSAPHQQQSVNFATDSAHLARTMACESNFETGTPIGSGREPTNATGLWSVSPYQVLIPSTGEGHVTVHVDAPGYDWLVYVAGATAVSSEEGPFLEHSGPVGACPEHGLVEYGAFHPVEGSWPLRILGEPGSRVRVYLALSATEFSDPDHAGHAGHVWHQDTPHEHGEHSP